jgi:hypothetical protein
MSKQIDEQNLAELKPRQSLQGEKGDVPDTRRNIADNNEFIDRFDITKVPVRPTKLVVVDQDPRPDSDVPAGTPVKLFMAFKEELPVESFANIQQAVKDKYPDVKSLLADLEKKNDVKAEATRKVLNESSKLSYDDLRDKDAKVINDFVVDRFHLDPNTQLTEIKNVYESIRFLNSF